MLDVPTVSGATLLAPAAVRLVDLEAPLVDLHLPPGRTGGPYRSLLAIARLDGDPLGSAVLSVGPDGRVPRELLELGLCSGLDGMVDARRSRRAPPKSALATSVSVVVTTCCDPGSLERCLRSVFACDYDDYEVIVVENRPGSGSTRRMLAERFVGSVLRYLEEPRPGLSRARNAGLEAADGDLVAFVDDDTVVDAGWIRRFVEGFDRAHDVDCVTGLILPLELETDSQVLLEQFAGFGKGFRRRIYRLPKRRSGDPLYPYAPGTIGSGANTVVRRSAARRLGGFDPTLGAGTRAGGGEDLDLYIRLILAGRAIAYEPGAIVWHEHPDGPDRLRRQVYRYGVGLGATLTKQLLVGPARRELLRATPAGVRHATDPGSRKNVAKTAAYPRRLDWLERLGMLAGPLAYLLSGLVTALRRRREETPAASNATVERVFLPNGRSVDVASFAQARPGPSTLPAPRAGPVARALTVTAALACVAAPTAVAVGLPAALRLPAVLALLCLAPGTAIVKALRGGLEPGLVLGTSLAASALIAQSMLWLGAWWPEPFLYVLAAACLPVLLAGRSAERPKARLRARLPRIPPEIASHLAVVAVAMVAWGTSLVGADLDRIAGTGLLAAMPFTYFLAFALLLVGFIVAMSRSVLEPRLLGLYVMALILVLHGTTPVLYDEPRYSWVFPHLGVINFIAEAGLVDRNVDIYNNWPGFFALNAWLTRLTGVPASAYAEWAQVFFNLANVAALRFALRGVTGNERLLWTATWLFLLGNWVAQDYLAPQAFAFVLALTVLGLALRSELRSIVPRTRPGLWLAERIARLRALMPHGRLVPEPRHASPLSPRGALVVGGLCYLAVVVSHQLTPVVLIAGMAGLALVARRAPLWVPVAMILVEVGWLALAWPYLGPRYDLFDPDPASSTAPVGYELGDGLSGLVLVAYAGRVELLVLAALALVGLARRLRARRWDLAAVILVAAPLLIVGVQSYGGEGRFRFYLFALPWLCFFGAAACMPATTARLSQAFRPWRLALATGVLGVCVLFAYFGLELSNRVRSEDVDAAVWFERHAPRDSLLVGLTSSFPRRLSARYPEVYDPWHPAAPALISRLKLPERGFTRRDLHRIEVAMGSFGARHTFLILTSSQERFARLFGLLPAGSVEGLAQVLRTSPSFRLVHARGDASIFRYKPRDEPRPP
jgi:GT2 family glycosyltransferase